MGRPWSTSALEVSRRQTWEWVWLARQGRHAQWLALPWLLEKYIQATWGLVKAQGYFMRAD